MRSKSSLQIIFVIAFALFVTACDSKKNEPAQDPITKAYEKGDLNIGLERVAGLKCLNVEKLFAAIRSLPGEAKARKFTSDLKMRTGYNLPNNFYLRMVAGNFSIVDTELSSLPDFPQVKQTDCSSLSLAEPGHDEVYKIVDSKTDSLTYSNQWGGLTTVTWVSPTSVRFDVTSTAYDTICDGNSQGKFTVTQQVMWGDGSIFATTLPESAISSDFLRVVTEAKGTTLSSLYTSPATIDSPITEPSMGQTPSSPEEGTSPQDPGASDPDIHNVFLAHDDATPVASNGQILVEKLMDLQSAPIRSELMQCY